MTLESYVSDDLLKLKKRLAKQGIGELSGMDYDAYLRSTLWQKIRAWVQERDDFCCSICRRKQTSSPMDEFDVHHRSYDLAVLEGKDDAQLVNLCRRCHEKVEYLPDGDKRTCLQEKDAEYERLSALHRRVLSEGMPLRIQSSTRDGASSNTVTYIGPKSHTEFYSLDSLMFGFVLNFYRAHRDNVRIPFPFGINKFHQPSGAKIIDKKTNKTLASVLCSGGSATLKVSKYCSLPIDAFLVSTIEETRPWRLAMPSER